MAGYISNADLVCRAGGCERPAKAKLFCLTHYAAFRRNGEVLKKEKSNTPARQIRLRQVGCSVEGCTRKHKAKGFCLTHYERLRAHGDPLASRKVAEPYGDTPCIVGGCGGRPVGAGFCANHYRRFRLYGDATGGKFIQSDARRKWHVGHLGYVVRYDPVSPFALPNGYVFRHREVMGQMIGRPLTRSESVHHVNGDKADNRPENLELWTKAQPAGQRVADLVSWAKEILARYPENLLAAFDLQGVAASPAPRGANRAIASPMVS